MQKFLRSKVQSTLPQSISRLTHTCGRYYLSELLKKDSPFLSLKILTFNLKWCMFVWILLSVFRCCLPRYDVRLYLFLSVKICTCHLNLIMTDLA